MLGAASVVPGLARSQGSASAADPPAPSTPPASDPAGPVGPGDDDEATTGGAATGLVPPPVPSMRTGWLADRIQAAVAARPTLARARIAVAVVDLATGEELFAHDADAPMNLASNTKVVTATAALATLGAGFRWRTAVFAAPPDPSGVIEGDLYLRGRGDPLLSAGNLESLADELVARGVRRIDGQLVLDTSYFDDEVEPPHFTEQPAERAAFRAPVASLGVARSAVTLRVLAEPGGGASIQLVPDAGNFIRITKRDVKSVTTGRTRVRIDTKLERDHTAYEVSGQIRLGEGSWDFRRRVDDPARFAGEVFRRALASRGITIRQRTLGSGAVPPTAKLLAFHDSLPLADVVRFMNKASDNYVAETLLKTLGAETRTAPGPATWADGITAVRAYLAGIGLAPGSYRVGNGSGLFAATEVSARQLVTVLRAAHADYRIGPDLLASLPIGGVDGTLARRWHDQPARGRVRAKTGTLEKVITLAGYIGVDSGRPLAFAILVNEIPTGQRPAARRMIDDMVNVLAAYLDAR